MHSCPDNNIDPDFLVTNMFLCFIEKTWKAFKIFKPYFHYCSSSAHYCEGHFHSHLYPQFKYMTFICS